MSLPAIVLYPDTRGMYRNVLDLVGVNDNQSDLLVLLEVQRKLHELLLRGTRIPVKIDKMVVLTPGALFCECALKTQRISLIVQALRTSGEVTIRQCGVWIVRPRPLVAQSVAA